MVDEVLASCYASFDHTLAHFATTTLQLFPQMVEWIIGGDNEIQDYVGMAKSVGRYLLPDTYLHVSRDCPFNLCVPVVLLRPYGLSYARP